LTKIGVPLVTENDVTIAFLKVPNPKHFLVFINYIATVYAKTYYCRWFENAVTSKVMYDITK